MMRSVVGIVPGTGVPDDVLLKLNENLQQFRRSSD
jgi:hypothetical protein